MHKYEVKEFDLCNNQLGDAGAQAIARMLRTNRSLTHLSLRFNKIGDAGYKALWKKKTLSDSIKGRKGVELML